MLNFDYITANDMPHTIHPEIKRKISHERIRQMLESFFLHLLVLEILAFLISFNSVLLIPMVITFVFFTIFKMIKVKYQGNIVSVRGVIHRYRQ